MDHHDSSAFQHDTSSHHTFSTHTSFVPETPTYHQQNYSYQHNISSSYHHPSGESYSSPSTHHHIERSSTSPFDHQISNSHHDHHHHHHNHHNHHHHHSSPHHHHSITCTENSPLILPNQPFGSFTNPLNLMVTIPIEQESTQPSSSSPQPTRVSKAGFFSNNQTINKTTTQTTAAPKPESEQGPIRNKQSNCCSIS